jgi:hypothetical protein
MKAAATSVSRTSSDAGAHHSHSHRNDVSRLVQSVGTRHICDLCRRVSAYDWVGEREARVRDDGANTFRCANVIFKTLCIHFSLHHIIAIVVAAFALAIYKLYPRFIRRSLNEVDRTSIEYEK